MGSDNTPCLSLVGLRLCEVGLGWLGLGKLKTDDAEERSRVKIMRMEVGQSKTGGGSVSSCFG